MIQLYDLTLNLLLAQQTGKSGVSALLLLILIIIIVAVLIILAVRYEAGKMETHHVEPEAHAPAMTETAQKAASVVLESPASATAEKEPAPRGAVPAYEPPAIVKSVPVPAVVEPASRTPSKPDDLTVLEGIGPKVNTILQNAGITTFAQLASAEVSHLKQILEANGWRFMDPATWPEQAKLAAEGRWDELKKLTTSLKDSRRVS
jgi:predicted flap endonuclease-1-like 5' DNA nuclease